MPKTTMRVLCALILLVPLVARAQLAPPSVRPGGPVDTNTVAGTPLSALATQVGTNTSGLAAEIARAQAAEGLRLLSNGGDASNTMVTAPGGTVARTLAARAGDTFNVADYGAKCDGVTDDAAAINAALAAVRARSAINSGDAFPIGRAGRLIAPSGKCLIKATLNATGLYGSGFVWDGWGTTLIGQTSGTPMIDATGTGQAAFLGLSLYGSSTNAPSYGLVLARPTQSLSVGADHNLVQHLTTGGYFTVAPYYNRSSETTLVSHAFLANYQASAYGAVFDGSNHFNFQSTFTGQTYTADTPSSFNENTCDDCIIEVFGTGSIPLWIGGTARHVWRNSYILSNHAGPAVYLYSTSGLSNDFLDLDIHVESTALTSYLTFGGQSAVTVHGLRVRDNAPQQSGPLFRRDAGVNTVTIQDADLRLGPLVGSSPSWWDSAVAYTVQGYVYGQDNTYVSPGGWIGTACIAGVCTTTTAFGALTASTVSATTVSASTINSALFANPGSVSSVSIGAPGTSGPNYWNSNILAGNLPSYTLTPADGNGGGGTATLSNIVMFGSPPISGGAGCTVGDTLNLIDSQTGGNLAGGGTVIVTVTSVSSGSVTGIGFSQTTGNAYLWAKPMSAATALTARSTTCTTLPTLGQFAGYPGATWAVSNGGSGSLKASISLGAAGSGYTTIPNVTPSIAYSSVSSTATGQIALTVNSTMTASTGAGKILMDSTGTKLGIGGTGGAPVIANGAMIDGSGVRVSLGSAYAVPANTSLVRLTQASTVASSTITLPTALADGQPVQFVNYAGQVTALTFSPAVNGWTNGSTLSAYSGARVRWDATAAAWYREQ